MTRGVRQNGMMSSRQLRGIVVAGLLCAAIAGCGSTVATSASVQAAQAAPAVGCASVSQATTATIHRTMDAIQPARAGAVTTTQHKTAVVRALFSDFCKIVAHPYTTRKGINCPMAFGLAYTGTFYDGNRVLATFTYGASGCQTVRVNAAGQSKYSLVMGPAASAAPHLETDMAAALGLLKSQVFPPTQQINPGGPNKPVTNLRQVAWLAYGRWPGSLTAGGLARLRQVARLVEVELAVLDPEDECLPLRLGEVELVTVGIGRVVHDVELGLIGLVRRGRGIGGDIHLHPALVSINRRSVVTRCVHAPRLPVAAAPGIPDAVGRAYWR
jgi:hypothetical protein